MTFSFTITPQGNAKLSVYDFASFSVLTVAIYPEGFSVLALSHNNERSFLSWPEDGIAAKENALRHLQEVIADKQSSPLLMEAASEMISKMKGEPK